MTFQSIAINAVRGILMAALFLHAPLTAVAEAPAGLVEDSKSSIIPPSGDPDPKVYSSPDNSPVILPDPDGLGTDLSKGGRGEIVQPTGDDPDPKVQVTDDEALPAVNPLSPPDSLEQGGKGDID